MTFKAVSYCILPYSPLTSKRLPFGTTFLMLIFMLSANCSPLYMRPNCGIFLLFPNLPAYEPAKMSDFYGVSSPRQTNLSMYHYYMNLLLVYQERSFINFLLSAYTEVSRSSSIYQKSSLLSCGKLSTSTP